MLKTSLPETATTVSQRRLGLVAVLFSVMLWAVAANTISSLLVAGVNPFELTVSSVAISTFGLAVVSSFRMKAEVKAMSRQQFILGLLFAGLIGANYLAIARLPVAVAILLLFTSPLMVVLWTALTTWRMPGRSVLAAMLLLIVGVVLVSKVVESNLSEFNGFGILIGLSSAVFFTAYNLQGERVGHSDETLGVMLKTFAVASVFWLAYQVTQGVPETLLEPENMWKILYVGIAGTTLPYSLFFWGIQRVQTERAVVIATLEPVIAAVLAWLWFGQTLTLFQIIGGILIVFAVTVLQLINSSSQSTAKIER
ncbi:EamA family transporter [Chlorogloea sp. CCALA 695]|uniref:EamA family transporter n=1 Tax=Chlorogloea sp. CCALA 695 TaxID=2107693 RepID=UPI0011B2972B|nr:EamA family transporter [Chlorogloea sp. CCALA 695]